MKSVGSLKPNRSALLAGLILASLFFLAAVGARQGWLTPSDRWLSLTIYAWRNERLTAVMRTVTALGNPVTLAIIALGLLFTGANPRVGFKRVMVIVGSGLLTEILKTLIARPRPGIAPLIIEPGYSFPSGHALGSLVVYGLVAWLVCQKLPPSKARWLVGLLAVFLIGAIGLSRVYLGVHYPSDILGGYLAGGVWLITTFPWWTPVNNGRP